MADHPHRVTIIIKAANNATKPGRLSLGEGAPTWDSLGLEPVRAAELPNGAKA